MNLIGMKLFIEYFSCYDSCLNVLGQKLRFLSVIVITSKLLHYELEAVKNHPILKDFMHKFKYVSFSQYFRLR